MVSRNVHRILRALRPGDHVCVVDGKPLPFLKEGAEKKKEKVRKDMCLYLGEAPIPEMSSVDFFPFKREAFDPDEIMKRVESYVKGAEKMGSSLRIVEDLTPITTQKGYADYETRMDALCGSHKVVCICLYPPEVPLEALERHPLIIVGGLLCRNFYYTPSPEKRVSSYLETLKAVHEQEWNLKKTAWKKRKQLSLSEKKYKALVEDVPDIICSLDSGGQIIEVNAAATSMLGYAREELVGTPFTHVVHPEDYEKTLKSFQELADRKRDRTIGLQFRLMAKDGSARMGELNARAMYDREGTFLRTEGIVRDITERREQQERLEFLAGVVENVMEAVIITDTKGTVTYVNPSASTVFGYSPEELVGQPATLLNSKNSPVTFQEIMKKGEWEGEMLAIKKNGERFPLWLRLSGLQNEKGEVTAFLSVSRDFTEQKRAEEALQRYALLLEMKVREKTRGTETVLGTSFALRSTSDWKKGVEIITKGIVEGLGFDRTCVFFVGEDSGHLECRGQLNISDAYLRVKVPLSDGRYAVVKCVREKNPILVKDNTTDPRVEAHLEEESREFVWVPILYQEGVLGAIGADRKWSQKAIEPEDVDMLTLYANQIAEFIERTRLVVEPEVEKQVATPLKYDLEMREAYLIEEDRPEKAFDIFTDLVKHGVRGFGICRTHPQKIREKYALEKTPMIWLSEMETKQLEHVGPQDVPKLVYLVAEFIKRAQPAVVLVEGVEYLIVQNDFKTVLKFLHTLSDYVSTSQSVLLLSLNPGVLSAHQHVMLKRTFRRVEE